MIAMFFRWASRVAYLVRKRTERAQLPNTTRYCGVRSFVRSFVRSVGILGSVGSTAAALRGATAVVGRLAVDIRMQGESLRAAAGSLGRDAHEPSSPPRDHARRRPRRPSLSRHDSCRRRSSTRSAPRRTSAKGQWRERHPAPPVARRSYSRSAAPGAASSWIVHNLDRARFVRDPPWCAGVRTVASLALLRVKRQSPNERAASRTDHHWARKKQTMRRAEAESSDARRRNLERKGVASFACTRATRSPDRSQCLAIVSPTALSSLRAASV